MMDFIKSIKQLAILIYYVDTLAVRKIFVFYLFGDKLSFHTLDRYIFC